MLFSTQLQILISVKHYRKPFFETSNQIKPPLPEITKRVVPGSMLRVLGALNKPFQQRVKSRVKSA